MLEKINIVPIIHDHICTLHVVGKQTVALADIVLFYISPAILASVLIASDIKMPEKYIDFCLIAYSIAIPLLFNVLFLIYSIKESHEDKQASLTPEAKRLHEKARRLLGSVYKNLSYTMLVSLAAVVAMGSTKLIGMEQWAALPNGFFKIFNPAAGAVIYFTIYFLMGHLFLTAMMIMKRTHVLLESEIEKG